MPPLDVYFDKYTVLQPDLLYLPGDRPAKNNPVDSLPELVVEILSPSSVRRDRVAKLNCYQRARVPHYWIVDPDNCIIEAYELRDQHYVSMVRCFDGTFVHPSFPGLSFDVSAFFGGRQRKDSKEGSAASHLVASLPSSPISKEPGDRTWQGHLFSQG